MNAVIYARFSCSRQREESIEGQIRECTAYAERNGIEIVGTYIDRAKSARTDNRPQFRKMAEDSDSGLFDAVIVWKLDRFSRNKEDTAIYKKRLRNNKIELLSATEHIPEGSSGIIFESVLEGVAEYYSADLSEKVLRGHHENALKCKSNGGTLPFGYALDNEKHFVIDPNTAPYVLSSFQMYVDGITMKEIANNLNFKGVLNTRGTKFTINSVSKMLSNIRYTGMYKYREIEKPDGIPRIVPDELFNRVQELIAKNKKAPAKHKAEDDYLLTTKLFCGRCKSLMVGESGTSKNSSVYRYYKCASAKKAKTCDKKAIKKDWIENIVIERIVAVLWDDELIEKVIKRIMKLQKEDNTTLVTLQKQLSETNRGINNMLNAIQLGIITDSTKDRLNELEATKRNIETEIAKERIKHAPITEEQILFWFEGFKRYDVTKLEYRKRLVDTFVNSIIVFDDRIEFYFNYKDGVETLSFKDLEKSSDLVNSLRPNLRIRPHESRKVEILCGFFNQCRRYDMGAWSVSLTGNDTAEDLKSEYQATFFYYDIETALSKIDEYVRAEGFDESDEEEWCNYYYSLADFMWRKGILTDSVRERAVQMIDSEFGLKLWAESGEKVLSKRKKVLSEFKTKLLSPQGEKKKIRVDLHLTPMFEVGDIVAFQLKTNDKTYLTDDSKFDEAFFKQADGKYVVARKIEDHISYRSSIVPEVADHWIVFQLYSKIFEELPDVSALNNIGWANTGDAMGTFVCESSLFYFKKRNYQVIGNNTNDVDVAVEEYRGTEHIFFGINMAHYNADTLLINAIV